MKLVLLAGTAFLGLAASGSAARAVPFDFTYTGSLVTFMVPTTDTYQILAFGAQGGNGIGAGGRGAEIGGVFSLTAGETLQIAVGGAGMSGDAGGGGGGSFVIGPANMPLAIAGGGGGGSVFGPAPSPGQGGLIGPDGGPGGLSGGNGGTVGNGGAAGGFVGAVAVVAFSAPVAPGTLAAVVAHSWNLAGGSGTSNGGFGGGGGGGAPISTRGAAGGGGGYSGGGGGGSNGAMGDFGPGGGGGSFDAGIDQILMADFQSGNGEVVITELAAAVPEPGSIALLGAGLISLAAVRRRRRPSSRAALAARACSKRRAEKRSAFRRLPCFASVISIGSGCIFR